MIRRSRVDARHSALSLRAKQCCGSRSWFSTTTILDDNGANKPTIEVDQSHTIPTHAFHERKHGNRSLPLSSFLDPFRIEQRHRHRNRTPKPEAPEYKDLDPFRQKLACNPYARLLAQPVRPCVLTGASVPRSLLINFKEILDPEPPHTKTLVPLTLYNKSLKAHQTRNGRNSTITKDRGLGQSVSLNRRLVQWLADFYEASRTLKGALQKYDGKMPPNTVGTINELLADIVTNGLRWLLQRGSKDFVSLPAGLADLSLCDEPAVVLFFGGAVYNKRLARLEARMDEIIQDIDASIVKLQIAFRAHRSAPALMQIIRRADPRILHPPNNLSALKYTTVSGGFQQHYSVPVIPMVDLLGEEGAKRLLQGTVHAETKFMAVRSTPSSARQVAELISCALWMKEGLVEKITLPKRE